MFHAVKFWIALRDQIVSEIEEKISEIACPLCGSDDVKKNGTRKTKVGERQRYLCLNCGKSFMLDNPFKKRARGRVRNSGMPIII